MKIDITESRKQKCSTNPKNRFKNLSHKVLLETPVFVNEGVTNPRLFYPHNLVANNKILCSFLGRKTSIFLYAILHNLYCRTHKNYKAKYCGSVCRFVYINIQGSHLESTLDFLYDCSKRISIFQNNFLFTNMVQKHRGVCYILFYCTHCRQPNLSKLFGCQIPL